jgi:hypothetical protein
MKRAALILLLIFPVFFPHHAQAAELALQGLCQRNQL